MVGPPHRDHGADEREGVERDEKADRADVTPRPRACRCRCRARRTDAPRGATRPTRPERPASHLDRGSRAHPAPQPERHVRRLHRLADDASRSARSASSSTRRAAGCRTPRASARRRSGGGRSAGRRALDRAGAGGRARRRQRRERRSRGRLRPRRDSLARQHEPGYAAPGSRSATRRPASSRSPARCRRGGSAGSRRLRSPAGRSAEQPDEERDLGDGARPSVVEPRPTPAIAATYVNALTCCRSTPRERRSAGASPNAATSIAGSAARSVTSPTTEMTSPAAPPGADRIGESWLESLVPQRLRHGRDHQDHRGAPADAGASGREEATVGEEQEQVDRQPEEQRNARPAPSHAA